MNLFLIQKKILKNLPRVQHRFCKKVILLFFLGIQVAGKTKFTEGILDFFGKASEIASPTFTIVNEHKTDNVDIYHFDVYRLSDVDEFYAIGGEEYFDNGICIIEWGELIESILPDNYLKIIFDRANDDTSERKLTFEPHGARFNSILERIVYIENIKYRYIQ